MDKEKRREYQKNYREENKDIIKQRKKDYNINNKEIISAYNNSPPHTLLMAIHAMRMCGYTNTHINGIFTYHNK